MKKYLDHRRYLCNFDGKQLPHVYTDVLVVGGGVGGLWTALEAARYCKVMLLTKRSLTCSNTMQAQGGVAAVMDRHDSTASHVRDTLATGQGLCDEAAVKTIVREGPDRVRELAQWGAGFDKTHGALHLTLEGGHSRARVVHAKGDATGSAVQEALLSRVLSTPNIVTRENTFVIDLIGGRSTVQGALCHGAMGGKVLIWARYIVLATGGLGRLFQETTNTEIATGDGVALAYRAGAVVRDLEFVQFHPTTLYLAGAARLLISEAVRGEGGVLRNNRDEAFMARYHAMGDLAPRDVVSQSILAEMKATGDTNVYLDMTGIPKRRRLERFPTITEHCISFGIDPGKQYIPVRPSAHYMIGGVKTNQDGATTVNRLFAVGEVASTGLHGANRLASNSLLEGMVMGRRAGAYIGKRCGGGPVRRRTISYRQLTGQDTSVIDVDDVRRALKSLMWRHVGVERSAQSLNEAVKRINSWCAYVMHHQFDDPAGWELQNMLTVAKLVTEGALRRKESRGCHYRTDFPEMDDSHWRKHTEFVRTR